MATLFKNQNPFEPYLQQNSCDDERTYNLFNHCHKIFEPS